MLEIKDAQEIKYFNQWGELTVSGKNHFWNDLSKQLRTSDFSEQLPHKIENKRGPTGDGGVQYGSNRSYIRRENRKNARQNNHRCEEHQQWAQSRFHQRNQRNAHVHQQPARQQRIDETESRQNNSQCPRSAGARRRLPFPPDY